MAPCTEELRAWVAKARTQQMSPVLLSLPPQEFMEQFWWQRRVLALPGSCSPAESHTIPRGCMGRALPLAALLLACWALLGSGAGSGHCAGQECWKNILTDHQRMLAYPRPALALLSGLGHSLWNTGGLWSAASWVAAVVATWRSAWSNLLRSPRRNKRRLLPCTMSLFPPRTKRQEWDTSIWVPPTLKRDLDPTYSTIAVPSTGSYRDN